MKSKIVILVVLLFITLQACANTSNTEPIPETIPATRDPSAADIPDTTPAPSLPIHNYEDISSAFTEKVRCMDDSREKMSLILDSLPQNEYVCSADTVYIPANASCKLLFSCTWDPGNINIYFGLKNNENTYLATFSRGEASGELDLCSIAEGEYNVILFSDNSPSTLAVMLYQYISSE